MARIKTRSRSSSNQGHVSLSICDMEGIPMAALLVAVVALSMRTTVTAMRFDLRTGQTKCISEDIKIDSMSVGKYFVINPDGDGDSQIPLPNSHRITLRVTSPHGNSIHHAENATEGNFAFTATETGDYLACFWALEQKAAAGGAVVIVFEFEWRSGTSAKNWGLVAKKGQIEDMEFELKKLEDYIRAIHDEMLHLREREEEMQDMNSSTSSRMAWLSFCSLLVCLAVAALQLFHLKNFFQRKKLL